VPYFGLYLHPYLFLYLALYISLDLNLFLASDLSPFSNRFLPSWQTPELWPFRGL